MRRLLRARLLASAFVLTALWPVAGVTPVRAQYEDGVSFDYFYGALQQYGYWLYSDRWGLVWQPAQVPEFFHPYDTDGHWAYTDQFGWYWVSDYPWGDIPFHYGRWVSDPDDGWLWIPGYTWSPAWVVWRTNGQFVGWMPAPPDERFLRGEGNVSFGISLGGASLSFSWDGESDYGYRTWYGPDFDEQRYANNWVFVGVGHIADADFRSYVVRDPVRVVNIMHNTTNITNYTVVNNYVVNRGVSINLVQRAAGHPIRIAPARMVIRNPQLVLRVDASRQIQVRERAFTPRGSGFANSAPPPPREVVGRLSVNVPRRRGPQPTQLFTRITISNPEVQTHFRGPPPKGEMVEPGVQHRPPEQIATPHALPSQVPPSGAPGTAGPEGQETIRHPEKPSPAASGPPSELQRRPEQGPPGGAPSEMGGPSGGPGFGPAPSAETKHHPEQGPPGGAPNEMGGPSGGPGFGPAPSAETKHHPEQGPPGGAPNEMGGPSGGPGFGPPPSAEMKHRPEQGPPSGAPGGMMGPQGAQAPAEQGSAPQKKHKPEQQQQPPGNPPPQ